MKKILALTLALIMCAFCFAACGQTNDNKDNNDDNGNNFVTLTIGYTNYDPMNYEDENGNLIGFDTEFAKVVCEKLGMEPKFQLIDWPNKYMELESGSIDCVWNGFTFNCADEDGIQRSDKVDFSYAYMNNEQCVVVKKNNLATLNSEEALVGKRVSAEDGSAGETKAKDLIGKEGTYVGVNAQMDTLAELKAGTIDFVVIDKTMAGSIIGKGNYTDLAIVDAITIESEQYAIGFKKGSELTAKINGVIKELAEDGTLAALAEKYNLSNYLITEYN